MSSSPADSPAPARTPAAPLDEARPIAGTPLEAGAVTPSGQPGAAGPGAGLPYKIACLCDLRDEQGRVLLLRRGKAPNLGLCSPIGGKLDTATGESPAQCARREIMEEAELDIPIHRLHLGGLISETAFEGRGHWLIFYYRVLGPVWTPPRVIREGRLEWHAPEAIESLPLPQTDRQVIWPLIRAHDEPVRAVPPGTGAGAGGGASASAGRAGAGVPGFFALHIDCGEGAAIRWTIEQAGPGWTGPRTGRWDG